MPGRNGPARVRSCYLLGSVGTVALPPGSDPVSRLASLAPATRGAGSAGRSKIPLQNRTKYIGNRASRLAGTDFIAYSILKAGVDMFTRVLAKDLGPRSITVNSVAPGFVKGDTYADLVPTQEVEDQIRDNTLLRRIGQPEEIADFVHALVGEAGRWVTGQNIEASGGFLF